jgi:membrane associated rhomboid family serine protease
MINRYAGLVIIPIGHDQEIRRLPWATFGIIAICTLVQIWASLSPGIDDIVRTAQVDEGRAAAMLDKLPLMKLGYVTGSGLSLRLITAAFVHAGWFHLIGNMLFLYLAGAVLEDRWGKPKFVVFYLVGAAASTLAFDSTYHGDPTMLVGASGAISALMGAFLVFYALTNIKMFYWLWRGGSGTFEMPAWLALPLWLGMQALYAKLEGDAPGMSRVAYMAHVGGFAFGFGVALVIRLIGGRREHDADEAIPTATAVPAPRRDDDRYDRCLDAIRRRDAPAVKTMASRVIIDLARVNDQAKIVELCKGMLAQLPSISLTDAAYAAAARAADHTPATYLAIADAFAREHPRNPALARVLWRAAELHRDAGDVEPAVAKLELLADQFPADPLGQQAADALRSRK